VTESAPDSPPAPPIAAAVIVKNGRVLLVQRRVKEGSLSWQFPAGAVEEGESASEAAVRETREETGLTVAASKILGERVHPATGRTMIYVACDVLNGEARVTDEYELADFAWSEGGRLAEYVPYGFYDPVQQHLDQVLSS
jgi:8-oxo-dGTP diphosphatase